MEIPWALGWARWVPHPQNGIGVLWDNGRWPCPSKTSRNSRILGLNHAQPTSPGIHGIFILQIPSPGSWGFIILQIPIPNSWGFILLIIPIPNACGSRGVIPGIP